MPITITRPGTKVESSVALLGTSLGLVGAVLVEPILLGLGAITVLVATIMRVSEHPTRNNSNHVHVAGGSRMMY